MMDYVGKLQRCHGYVEALEAERRKIQVFQRELPLCLELVTQAIEACRRELSGTTTEYNNHGQSESEQTSSEGPVLAEFLPIKPTHSSNSDNDDHNHDLDGVNDDQEHESHVKGVNSDNIDNKRKSDWLRSVQLWNQSTDPSTKEDVPRKAVVTEVKSNGLGAFQPFQKEKSVGKSSQIMVKPPSPVPPAATSSSAETLTGGSSGGVSSKKDEKEGKSHQKKQRRNWSPELHRRFLHALQKLGGSHAATPKQIRELMKVDGLTNDEVKSHLQKYRLHTRRPTATIQNSNNTQAPQFVVVGGIWVPPPPEYAAVVAASTSSETTTVAAGAEGIYAPKAMVPTSPPQASASTLQKPKPKPKPEQSEKSSGGSHSDRDQNLSNSIETSSSTHTTTNSQEL